MHSPNSLNHYSSHLFGVGGKAAGKGAMAFKFKRK